MTRVLSVCLQPQSGTRINVISLSWQAVSGLASELRADQRVSAAAVRPQHFAFDLSDPLLSGSERDSGGFFFFVGTKLFTAAFSE